MSEMRMVPLASDDLVALNEAVEELFRAGANETALRLAALTLRLGAFHAPTPAPARTEDNVVELRGYSRKVPR
jgi:hypothetical protein